MKDPSASPESTTPPPDLVSSAKQVVRSLDRAWRAARTYGRTNAATERFVSQLGAEAAAFVAANGPLGVIVEPTLLRMGEHELLAGGGAAGDGLPFRFYSDGVREVRLLPGVDAESLGFLVDALHDSGDDDDVVTRLWSKDLEGVALVTAEDLLVDPHTGELVPQEHGYFAPPPASFEKVVKREQAGGNPSAIPDMAATASGLTGYELTDAERERIAADMEAERNVVDSVYALAALDAVLRVETSTDLLARGLSLVPSAFDTLCRRGDFAGVAGLLERVETLPQRNPGFDPGLARLAVQLSGLLGMSARLVGLAAGFAVEPPTLLAPLKPRLMQLRPTLTPTLLELLSAARSDEQRAVVREVVASVGEDAPDVVLQSLHLTHVSSAFLVDVIEVLRAWKQPLVAPHLATLAVHPSIDVRKAAVAALAELVPANDGVPLAAFALDADRQLRLSVLRLLTAGKHRVPIAEWTRLLQSTELAELPPADQRSLFHAIRVTAADAAVPWFRALLDERGWRNRQAREHLALVAVDMLGTLGTPAAREALKESVKTAPGAVRKACEAAVEAIDARARKAVKP